MPIVIEVGFSQLVMRSPAALPTGTRPPAIPPIAAPNANGVSTDDTPKMKPTTPSVSRSGGAPLRSAYAEPRMMIPTAAMNSGTARVEAIEPKAVGYADHDTTRTKRSHTWLASHTGAIA